MVYNGVMEVVMEPIFEFWINDEPGHLTICFVEESRIFELLCDARVSFPGARVLKKLGESVFIDITDKE